MGHEVLAAHLGTEVSKSADVGADDALVGVDQGEVEVKADDQGCSHIRDPNNGLSLPVAIST